MSVLVLVGLVVAGNALPVTTVQLSTPTPGKPIRIACPSGQATRIVFPERAVRVMFPESASEGLGILPERSRPLGVITVTPRAPSIKGVVEFTGPHSFLTLELESVAGGLAAEVRLVVADPSTPAPAAPGAPAPPRTGSAPPILKKQVGAEKATPAAAPSPLPAAVLSSPPPTTPVRVPAEPAPSPAAVATGQTPAAPLVARATEAPPTALDLADLGHAKTQRIGRHEGQPGRTPMTLEKIDRGAKWAFVHFSLPEPSAAVEDVVWEAKGKPATPAVFDTEVVAGTLSITAQIPAAMATSKTRMTVRVRAGGTYKFVLRDGSLLHLIFQ